MTPTKQTVYLPVKVEDELPNSKDGSEIEVLFQYKGILFLGWFNPETKFFSTSNGLAEYYTDVDLWFKLQEAFVFTPEQLNEYTANVIKQALEIAAEDAISEPFFIDGEPAYTSDRSPVDKQSITNTFKKIFQKYKV